MNGINPPSWHELALALADKLTGRGTEITYEAKDLIVHVPEVAGAPVSRTPWMINGTIRISTQDAGK